MTPKNLDQLEKILGCRFKNQAWLKQALVHRSFLNEAKDKKISANERLEFLGDAILEFVISELLYQHFPDYPEGTLTNLRSNLVKTETLGQMASQFGIGEFLLMSKGEKETGGQNNPTLLANTMEAIIGALYLDQGLAKVKKFIHQHFLPLLGDLINLGEFKDYKSLLQEKLQAQVKKSPVYQILKESGPDHDKIFQVGVFSQGLLLATGEGKSKQTAEEAAAQAGLEKISQKK